MSLIIVFWWTVLISLGMSMHVSPRSGWKHRVDLTNGILCINIQTPFLYPNLMSKQWKHSLNIAGDEPPHQIRSYTLLFLLFLCFLYIADPPLHTSAPTRSHLLHQTDLTYLMDIWLTIHMYLLLCLVSPTCPLLRSDQSQALTPRSQALSITLPYAHFRVFHSYLTCLYLPFTGRINYQSPNQLPIPVSPRIEIVHLRFTPSHTYFTLFRITSHCHNRTVSTCQNTPGDNPLSPDCTPSEPHRIYT